MPLLETDSYQAILDVAYNLDIANLTPTRNVAYDRIKRLVGSVIFDDGINPKDLANAHRWKILRKLAYWVQSGKLIYSPNERDKKLKEVVRNPRERARLLKSVDLLVSNSSQKNIAAIDAALLKDEYITKELVIIGGGPTTSMAASILAPYFNVTVITNQDRIGEPWRSRPLFINSSVEERNVDAPRLPLLEGTTTPIVSTENPEMRVSLSDVLDDSVLTVKCADKSSRRYISGMALGATVAISIASDVDDYLVGHTFVPEETVTNLDGTKTVVLMGQDGKKRKIKTKVLMVLTGPGQEVCKLNDSQSKADFALSKEQINQTVAEVKQAVKENVDVKDLEVKLPRILTFSDIERLYQLWINDLRCDPAKWPLAPLFEPGVTVAVIGGRDTALSVVNLLQGNAPKEAYPERFELHPDGPKVELFNTPIKDLSELDLLVRRRYRNAFVGSRAGLLRLNRTRVQSCVLSDGVLHQGAKVFAYTGLNRTSFHRYDYVIQATGLERQAIEAQLPYAISKLEDVEGNTVALGTKDQSLVIAGSATGFTSVDLPDQLQAIVRTLRIPENTISLWVHNNLVERICWQMLGVLPLNQDKLRQLRDAYEFDSLLNLAKPYSGIVIKDDYFKGESSNKEQSVGRGFSVKRPFSAKLDAIMLKYGLSISAISFILKEFSQADLIKSSNIGIMSDEKITKLEIYKEKEISEDLEIYYYGDYRQRFSANLTIG